MAATDMRDKLEKIIEAYEVYDKQNPAVPVKKQPPKRYKKG